MTRARDPRTKEIVDRIVAHMEGRHPSDRRALAEEFVRQYFAGTAAEDLAETDGANLYGAAMAHLNYAQQRTPGTAKRYSLNSMAGRPSGVQPHEG